MLLVILLLVSSCSRSIGSVWTAYNVTLAPTGRSGAAGAQLGNGSLLIHGGCTSSCCYAPLADTWLLMGGTASWTPLGDGSSGRLNHVALPAKGGSVLVFGGSTGNGGFLNDLWRVSVVFDSAHVPKSFWTQLSAQGASPVASRAGHAAASLPSSSATDAVDADAFVGHGGVNEDSVLGDMWVYSDGTWSQVQQSSPAPGPRTQHTLVVYNESVPAGL